MQSTNPQDVLITLHLIRAGLASGLLSKEEVINWADNIITLDEQPDIFFIDLALLGSKSKNDLVHYISNYLNFEYPTIRGRPLLGILYKRYESGQLNGEQTVRILYRLGFEAIFSDIEKSFIYTIESDFDLAHNGIYGSLKDVLRQTERFLEIYQEYSIDNYEQWQDLDKHVELILENEQK